MVLVTRTGMAIGMSTCVWSWPTAVSWHLPHLSPTLNGTSGEVYRLRVRQSARIYGVAVVSKVDVGSPHCQREAGYRLLLMSFLRIERQL